MKTYVTSWRDYLIPLWLILVSLLLLQSSLLRFERTQAMGVLESSLSSLRGRLRAYETLMWHIHGPQPMEDDDFNDLENY